MSETIATFMDSLTAEETQEFADELERRRVKIDALRARALARLSHLKEAVKPQP
jgi:16S rRNA G527 N7-methylase RsmG